MNVLKTAARSIEFSNAQMNILEAFANGAPVDAVTAYAFANLEEYHTNRKKLAIGINDECNLSCKHCYYPSSHDFGLRIRKNLLTEENWRKIVAYAIFDNVTTFSIAGKEPLMSPDKTFAILDVLEHEKQVNQEISYEMLTNGTLLAEHAEHLKEYHFENLVVSMDGNLTFHNKIRGQYAFEQLERGLDAAKAHDLKTLAVTTIEINNDANSLKEMFQTIMSKGINRIGIGFCVSTDYNGKIGSSIDDVYETLRAVEDFDKEREKGMNISVNLSATEHAPLVAELYHKGVINKNNMIFPDEVFPQLFFEITPYSMLQVDVIPSGLHNALRIDCDGAVVADCFPIMSPETRGGFTNIRDHKFEIEPVYAMAKKMWIPYVEHLYGGLRAALVKEKNDIVQA